VEFRRQLAHRGVTAGLHLGEDRLNRGARLRVAFLLLAGERGRLDVAWHAVFSYSMTSSAPARIDCGTVSPSAFAVLRLTTNWNLLACSTGKSPGFAPFRILST